MVVPGKTLIRVGGAPILTAPQGTLAVNTVGEEAYINQTGAAVWTQIDIAPSGTITFATVFCDSSPTNSWACYIPGTGSNSSMLEDDLVTTSPTFGPAVDGYRNGCRPNSTANNAEGVLEPANTQRQFARQNNFQCSCKANWADSTDRRYYILAYNGNIGMNTILDTDDPAANAGASYAGFRFSTAVPDAGIIAVVGDGATQQTDATGIGVPGVYIAQMFADEDAGTITLRLLNNLGTVILYENTFSTNIPAAGTGLRLGMGQRNLAAGSQPVWQTFFKHASLRVL